MSARDKLSVLKDRAIKWNFKVETCRQARATAKHERDQAEIYFKSMKRAFYVSTKDWNYARKQYAAALNRVKRFNSDVRKNNLKHPQLIFEGNE